MITYRIQAVFGLLFHSETLADILQLVSYCLRLSQSIQTQLWDVETELDQSSVLGTFG